MRTEDVPVLKREPVDRIILPFERFMQNQASGGIVLLACAIAAMIWANSPWGESYEHIWHMDITVGFGELALSKSLHFWINDFLMAIFFFVVGLEIKREILVGALSTVRQAALPIIAAFAGMMGPAAIYASLNWGSDAIHGWGVPVATDIAFALGVLALMGSRVPLTARVFLAAVAIADDLGATLVIAIFYTEELSMMALGIALGIFVLMGILNRAGFRSAASYGVLGILMWVALLKSGVHPTMAGVLSAIMIPTRTRIDGDEFVRAGRRWLTRFASSGQMGTSVLTNSEQRGILESLEHACEQAQTPLQRLEHALEPWVAFVIMPVFALSNAGVTLDSSVVGHLVDPVGIGISLGLVIGKQIGIFGSCWLAVKLGIGKLPAGLTWRHMWGLGWLGGIGFTMALFIAGLAFSGTEYHGVSKAGILLGSLIAGIGGWLVLRSTKPAGNEEEGEPAAA